MHAHLLKYITARISSLREALTNFCQANNLPTTFLFSIDEVKQIPAEILQARAMLDALVGVVNFDGFSPQELSPGLSDEKCLQIATEAILTKALEKPFTWNSLPKDRDAVMKMIADAYDSTDFSKVLNLHIYYWYTFQRTHVQKGTDAA